MCNFFGKRFFYSIGNFSEFSYRIKTLRGMRTAAYEVDVAMRPPQARVSQAKLFVLTTDDRVLKYKSEKIEIVTPGEFIRRMEEKDDE